MHTLNKKNLGTGTLKSKDFKILNFVITLFLIYTVVLLL